MSPASSGSLEVERYIGACLISQNRSKNATVKNREFFPHIYHQGSYVNLQRCTSVDGWAGGMPLISFANQRRGRRNDQERLEDSPASPLARLAVHTQGAPLILTKSYNHRKNKVHRNNGSVQQTKIFENSNNRKQNKCQEQHVKGVDAISVTSDESSGSQNSESCLPRIIKPRKRRKKDRKPTHLARSLSQEDFSTDIPSPDIDNLSLAPLSPFLPFIDAFSYRTVPDSNQFFDLLGDIPEAPKLHHSFEDVEEVKDVNGNQPTSTCQCRYCDPSGQIWDVDRNCYSPFLTPPKAFHFPNLNLESYSSQIPPSEDRCLVHSMSSISLEEAGSKRKAPFSRSSSSSSTSSTRDLEVSTEIVTSLNGHRDLEIKFISASVVENKSGRDEESGGICEKYRVNKCAVNSQCKFVSEE